MASPYTGDWTIRPSGERPRPSRHPPAAGPQGLPMVAVAPVTRRKPAQDQGNQFTSLAFTRVLKDAGMGISMDGKGPRSALAGQTPAEAYHGRVADSRGHAPERLPVPVAA